MDHKRQIFAATKESIVKARKKLIFVLIFLGVFLINIGTIYACVEPTSGMIVTSDTALCSGEYMLDTGITIAASDVNLACEETILNAMAYHFGNGITVNEDLNNIVIQGCEIKRFDDGIHAKSGGNNIRILNNKLNYNNDGIYAKSILYSEIGNNDFLYNEFYGIYIDALSTKSSYGLDIHDNYLITYLDNVNRKGIGFVYTGGSDITGNTIVNGLEGIDLYLSSHNSIYDNIITEAKDYGIRFWGSSYNLIQKNDITDGGYEVTDYGVGIKLSNLVLGEDPISSSSNYITENYFADNKFGMSLTWNEVPPGWNPTWHNTFVRNSQAHAIGQGPFYINEERSVIAKGNTWGDIWSLGIYDLNGDGYGDAGPQYPYSGANGAHAGSSVADYGPRTSKTPSCGDSFCWGSETCGSCYADCSVQCSCGDGICSPNESNLNCAQDCPKEIIPCQDNNCTRWSEKTKEILLEALDVMW